MKEFKVGDLIRCQSHFRTITYNGIYEVIEVVADGTMVLIRNDRGNIGNYYNSNFINVCEGNFNNTLRDILK